MKRLAGFLAVAVFCTLPAFAQGTNQTARDWYVEQKRIQKMARAAAVKKDTAELNVAERMNYDHRRKLEAPWGAPDSACEVYQLRVYRLITNASRGATDWQSDDQRAGAAGDACWDSIVKKR